MRPRVDTYILYVWCASIGQGDMDGWMDGVTDKDRQLTRTRCMHVQFFFFFFALARSMRSCDARGRFFPQKRRKFVHGIDVEQLYMRAPGTGSDRIDESEYMLAAHAHCHAVLPTLFFLFFWVGYLSLARSHWFSSTNFVLNQRHLTWIGGRSILAPHSCLNATLRNDRWISMCIHFIAW